MTTDPDEIRDGTDLLKNYTLSRRTFLVGSTMAAIGVVGVACGIGGQGGGKTGGMLAFASSTATPSDLLDPIRQLSNFEIIAVGTIFDSLTRVDEQFMPHPAILDSWDSSDGGKTWQLKLRSGVTFHDGSSVTADDVAYSIQRNLNPKGSSPVVGLLGPYLGPNDVVAVDKSTVRLALSAPYAFIPVALGNRYMRVIKQGATDFTRPVGTGPFVFKAHSPGQSFSVTRNANYWAGAPKVDGINSSNIPDDSARLQALLAGNVHVVEGIQYSQVPSIKSSSSHTLVVLQNAYIPTVEVDLTAGPFKDPRVVTALKLAIDRKQLVDIVFQGLGSVGYDTPIPSNDFFFDESLPQPTRDVERAKFLLRQAGYPTLEQEFVVSPIAASMVDFGVAVQQQLQEAGMRIQLRQWPASTYWDDVWLKASMNAPIYIRRHPDEIMTYLATSKGPWNGTHWANSDFDSAIKNARGTLDRTQQKSFYATAQELESKQDGHIMPVFSHLVAARANSAAGVDTNFISLLDFSRASLG